MWDDTAGRSGEYFQDILREPEVLRDSKCQEIVRKAQDYFQMSYENKLKYWTQNTKPSRWPQLLAALSYAEVRINRESESESATSESSSGPVWIHQREKRERLEDLEVKLFRFRNWWSATTFRQNPGSSSQRNQGTSSAQLCAA